MTDRAPETFTLPFPERTLVVRLGDDSHPSTTDEPDLHWANLWPSSLALAGALLAGRWTIPHDQEILEIGCGTGLASLAIAARGGQVCASDRVVAALSLVRMNAELNGLDNRITTQESDWNDKPTRRWPLIVAADVLYQSNAGRPVARFLYDALTDQGVALLTDPDRPGARHFHLMAQEAGLAVDLQRLPVPFVATHGPVTALRQVHTALTVTLFVLRRRQAGPA